MNCLQLDRRGLLNVVSIFFLLAGCSRDPNARPDPVPVSGIVLLNGTPLGDATVVMQPQWHQFAAQGVTDQEGRFVLTTFSKNDGAVPGLYKIAVIKQERGEGKVVISDDAPSSGPPKLLVPEAYVDPSTSGLESTVEQLGKTELKLELTGTPENKPMSLKLPPPRPVRATGE